MKGSKIPHLIGFAALGWLFLIGFQVKWLKDSRDLIEQQFDQKVTMALCAAVGSLDSTEIQPFACGSQVADSPVSLLEQALENPAEMRTMLSDSVLRKALDESMRFYDIHLPYEVSISEPNSGSCNPASPYCCPIAPFAGDNAAQLLVFFPGKNIYLLKKMWAMLASSVFILLFILLVFVLTIRALIRQKRISQFNIDFFNNMAHEFKTPLTNIRLAMKRLVAKHPNLQADPYVEIVANEDEKLAGQIEGVLNLAKLENGDYIMRKERINLQELLGEVIREMDLQIKEAQGEVDMPALENVEILGDPFHLSRVFRNLIDNSLKYTEQQPKINIRSEIRDAGVAIIVEDNGVGISKANREIVFDKFQRIGNEMRHDQKGFGLGLAYVKMIMEKHKGKVQIFGDMQQGSKFELFLPNNA